MFLAIKILIDFKYFLGYEDIDTNVLLVMKMLKNMFLVMKILID